MRVHELAKQLGVSSKELLQKLAELDILVKNHMSSLSDADVERVIRHLKPAAGKQAGVTVDKPQRTVARKKSRAATEETPAAPEPARRTHLLIKKRPVEEAPAPQTVEAEAATAGSTAEDSVETALKETSGAGLAPAARAETGGIGTTKGAAPPSEAAGERPQEEAVPAGQPTGTDQAEKAPPGREALQDEEEKKGKLKKARKPKWDRSVEMFDYRQELTRLHEFRPFHRRDERFRGAARRGHSATITEITKPRKKVVKLTPGLTIKEFSELIGQKATTIIAKLMQLGVMSTINQPIDLEVATLIAEEFGIRAEAVTETTEAELLPTVEDSPESLRPRPPVVTIMGHVDHGKTSLLDAIRKTRVTESEAGGITQHIGAYTVSVGGRQITFLDTPGHEAFTAMRARGAKVTDIVILVVAADDGVMPQTVEAINHARAANVPIIVAINKIDKPEANPERVRATLAEQGLIPEAWGGQTIYVEISAKKRVNLDTLLEMVLLQAEVMELKANPDKPARGVIIEAKLDRGRGPVATVLVQEGVLRIGDAFVTGLYSGRVRGLINDLGERIDSAGPSTPVEVIGLEGVPQAGDTFVVTEDERVAREIANQRAQKQRLAAMATQHKVNLEDIYRRIQEGTVRELNLVVKADVQGSVEAVCGSMEKLATSEVKVKIIHSGVGGITESDVLLASASEAIIIGFNVRPDAKAQSAAEREKVDIRLYTVIYDAVADIRAAMQGLLEPTYREKVLGRAEVRQIFNISRVGTVAGCYVSDGTISRGSTSVRVIRDNVVVHEGKLASLKRFKDDVREVQSGFECGLSIENFNDVKPGDVIEAFVMEQVEAKL